MLEELDQQIHHDYRDRHHGQEMDSYSCTAVTWLMGKDRLKRHRWTWFVA